jgi:uncharacterized membrane protein YbaN (DUF454 family)
VNLELNQGPPVVHSSLGRLRVHLPDPAGHAVTRLRLLPGVTSACASKLTGNILILFDSQRTSEEALLAELGPFCPSPPAEDARDRRAHAAPLAAQPRTAETKLPLDDFEDVPAEMVTGFRAKVYKAMGWASVGMAIVGAIMPGIPTAPFVILASYFFIRSSPAARRWLLNSRWFGQILRDWEQQRGVRRWVKWTAVTLMVGALVFAYLSGLPTAVVAAILSLEVIGLIIILRLPVVDATPAPQAV